MRNSEISVGLRRGPRCGGRGVWRTLRQWQRPGVLGSRRGRRVLQRPRAQLAQRLLDAHRRHGVHRGDRPAQVPSSAWAIANRHGERRPGLAPGQRPQFGRVQIRPDRQATHRLPRPPGESEPNHDTAEQSKTRTSQRRGVPASDLERHYLMHINARHRNLDRPITLPEGCRPASTQ
jgi:hypothetical protein